MQFDPNVFTIGFARRATPYKRADLIFTELDRLRDMTRRVGPLQIVFSGKAHPRDEWGKALIKRIFEAKGRPAADPLIVHIHDITAVCPRCGGTEFDPLTAGPLRLPSELRCKACGTISRYLTLLDQIGEEATAAPPRRMTRGDTP